MFIFFLNVVNPKPGQAFICSPDEPHAYLQGELIEAMVNSDNVVRGGLTPKYKDKDTLMEVSIFLTNVQMLIYKFNEVSISEGAVNDTVGGDKAEVRKYATGYKEFCVTSVALQAEAKVTLPKFAATAIVFVLDGDASVEWEGMKSDFTMNAKKAYMLLPETEISLKAAGAGSKMFICHCDL